MLPPAEETLDAAAGAVRELVTGLLATAREAELRVVFSPATERALRGRAGGRTGGVPGLPAAALRSLLGDRLHRAAPELFVRTFEPDRFHAGGGGCPAFALAGPPDWNGGEAVVRIRTWDPGAELLPAFVFGAAASLADRGDERVLSVECEAIRRIDAAASVPAAPGENGAAWRLRIAGPLQLRAWVAPGGAGREHRQRRLLRADEVGPGRLARAAWLRLAEISRHWGAGGLRLEPRFVESPVFAALAAALDAVAPPPCFHEARRGWRSRRQGTGIDLSGIGGTWPAEGAWPVGEAAAGLGSAAAGLLELLWRAAVVFQLGHKTAYGCGAVEWAGPPASKSEKKATERAENRGGNDGFSEGFSLAKDSFPVSYETALEGMAPHRGG